MHLRLSAASEFYGNESTSIVARYSFFSRIDFSEETIIIVGSEGKRFTVRRCLLTKSSDFFQACSRGEWQEVSTKTTSLPEVDVESFSTYLQWLYTGAIVVSEDDITDETDMRSLQKKETERFRLRHLTPLLKLAVLADRLGDAQLSNSASDTLIQVVETIKVGPNLADIHLVYKQLPDNSTFRRLLVDMFNTKCNVKFLIENQAHLPAAFIFDLMVGLREERRIWKSGVGTRYSGDRCQYHQHNDKVPKCS